ncbi:hypothetical protein QBC41DRAFT_139211 [Cercophora samala]|uniref:Uncharacterized protein n=1 Tax=Cercophora samala TaxID=330535 RepID=A0AA39ZAI2_9PEZI|nr:hypothetical protein QBC41DRAFT_139211 [Cercophora samala]
MKFLVYQLVTLTATLALLATSTLASSPMTEVAPGPPLLKRYDLDCESILVGTTDECAGIGFYCDSDGEVQAIDETVNSLCALYCKCEKP